MIKRNSLGEFTEGVLLLQCTLKPREHHALKFADFRKDSITNRGVDIEVDEVTVNHITLLRHADVKIGPFPFSYIDLEPVGRNLCFRALGFPNEFCGNIDMSILIFHMIILQKIFLSYCHSKMMSREEC